MNPDPELLALCGPLVHCGREDAPTSAVAQGFRMPDLAHIATVFAVADWAPIGLWDCPTVHRHRHISSLIAIATARFDELIQGSQRQVGGMVVLDGAQERAVARLVDLEGRAWLLDTHQGRIDLWTWADALDGLTLPADPLSLQAPPVEQWAQVANASPWLVTLVRGLAASPAPLDRLSAAGQLSRLWESPEGEPIPLADHPRERVRAWMNTISLDLRQRCETLAVDQAEDLGERIDRLGSLSDPEAGPEAGAIVLDRDNLQGSLRALRLGAAGDRLAERLSWLDDHAVAHISAFAGRVPAHVDEEQVDRWSLVAWKEPEAWWAGGE